MRKSLTKTERLKSRTDFSQVFENSNYLATCKGAKLLTKRNGLSFNRFGVTMVKKYGNAVQRNYARRIFKEFFRNSKETLLVGFDIVIVLLPGEFCYQDRKCQFLNLIRRTHLVK